MGERRTGKVNSTKAPLSRHSAKDTVSTIGAFDAKTHFSTILKRARNGEQIVITFRGEPVAKLVPFSSTPDDHRVELALATIRDLSKKYAGRGITLDDITSWTNQGRP